MRPAIKIIFLAAFLLAPALALAGYGEGGYYGGEGGYYSQSYYQSYYQGSYSAQDVVNMRSTLDQCGQRNNPPGLACNNWPGNPNTLGTVLEPATAGAFVFRATTGANSFALSSFCRAWGKSGNSSGSWTPQLCADGPNGGSLPASIPAGTGVTLEYWNRARAHIGYANGCNFFCGDRMDWYDQNFLPNCSTNFGAAVNTLTSIGAGPAQQYGSATVFPLVNTTYTVNCSGGDPGNLSRSITINVTAASSLTFNAISPVAYNSASTLSWSSNLVHNCTLAGGIWGGGSSVATSNGGISTGNLTAPSTAYTLSCLRDSDNTVISQVQTVLVDQCTNILGTQSGAPANGSEVGGTCTCNSGYTLNGGTGLCDPDATSVSISTIDGSAFESPLDTGTYRLSRTGLTGSALTVNVSFSSGAGFATNGTDFTSVISPVTIAAGSGTKDITITPIADGTTEGSEIVRMSVVAGGGYGIGAPSSADITINDAPSGTITGGSANGLQVICASGGVPASSCRIRKGSPATLSWSTTNMTTCSVRDDRNTLIPGTSGVLNTAGVATPAVNQATLYTLSCTDGVGVVSTAQARVSLIPSVIECGGPDPCPTP